jgi:hypothetical protein
VTLDRVRFDIQWIAVTMLRAHRRRERQIPFVRKQRDQYHHAGAGRRLRPHSCADRALFAILAPEAFCNLVALYAPYNRHFNSRHGAFMPGLDVGLALALFFF